MTKKEQANKKLKAKEVYDKKMKILKALENQGMKDYRKRRDELWVEKKGRLNQRSSVDVTKVNITDVDKSVDSIEYEETPLVSQSIDRYNTIDFFDEDELF